MCRIYTRRQIYISNDERRKITIIVQLFTCTHAEMQTVSKRIKYFYINITALCISFSFTILQFTYGRTLCTRTVTRIINNLKNIKNESANRTLKRIYLRTYTAYVSYKNTQIRNENITKIKRRGVSISISTVILQTYNFAFCSRISYLSYSSYTHRLYDTCHAPNIYIRIYVYNFFNWF